MKITRVKNIKKPYFNLTFFANAMELSHQSAKVVASRYVKEGIIIRLKRDLYTLPERWDYFLPDEKFLIANILQSPSYISLQTALSYYEISTQIQQDFIESVALKRTKQVNVKGTVFQFSKLKKDLYFGFVRKEGFFIALAEKALLDAIYLMTLKKYTIDLTSLDFNKFDLEKLNSFLEKYPTSVKKIVKSYVAT